MIPSNIKISAEVLESNKLTPKRKRQLREEAIMKLIDSKPVGTPIILKEFGEVSRIPRTGNVSVFISRMVRDKLIGKYETEKKSTYSYAVLRGAKTVKPARLPEVQQPAPNDPIPQPTKLDSAFATVERLAKEFAWEANSDSVREFIPYLKGRL